MTKAGPLSTITIAFSSFLGVITGGIVADRWIMKNLRSRDLALLAIPVVAAIILLLATLKPEAADKTAD